MEPNPLVTHPAEIKEIARIVDERWPDPGVGRKGEAALSLGLQPVRDALCAAEPDRISALKPLRHWIFIAPERNAIRATPEGWALLGASFNALAPHLGDRLIDIGDIAATVAGLREDVCLLAPPSWEEPDGLDRLVFGAVAFPSRWILAQKLGKPMREIHVPVPDLNQKMGQAINRLFERLVPGRAVRRSNWLLTDDPHLDQQEFRVRPIITCEAVLSEMFVRTETQTLVRLWSGGPLLFLILVRQARLDYVVESVPRGRERLKLALKGTSPAMIRYKSLNHHMPAILAALG